MGEQMKTVYRNWILFLSITICVILIIAICQKPIQKWDCDELAFELEAHGIHSVYDVMDPKSARFYIQKCDKITR